MKITDELLYAHAAAGQALWLSTLPDPAELDPFVPSRWFQRKMKKLLRQCRRTPRVNTAIRYTKRVALTALVSAVVIFSSLMTVASFRAKVVEVITEVFDTLTSYIFRPGEAESAPLSELSLAGCRTICKMSSLMKLTNFAICALNSLMENLFHIRNSALVIIPKQLV